MFCMMDWRIRNIAPAPADEICGSGLVGRKTQRGFYDYRGETPVPTR